MPKVSVIIPAYNPGPYLDLAVQSVIEQSVTDWELIVIDDGSTQDISHIADKHPALRFYRQSNQGVSSARNAGIFHSEGEFIAFLDNDDLWKPTKLARQVEFMAKDASLGLCYTQFEFIDAEGQCSGPGYSSEASTYLDLLAGRGSPVLSTSMVRRSSLSASGLFDPFYPGIQDYDFFLKIARFHKVGFLSSCEASYRLHGNNASRNFLMVYREVENVLQKHRNMADVKGDQAALRAVARNLAAARQTYGSQAFDQSRRNGRERNVLGLVQSLALAFSLSPGYVLKSLAKWRPSRNRS